MKEKTKKTTDTVVESDDGVKKTRASRKLRFGTIATVTTVVVVVMVLLLNVVMEKVEDRYPLTVDLTAEGTFSLSQESLTLARNVQNPTEVIVFVNENLFTADDYTPFQSYLYTMQQALVSYYGNSLGAQYYNEFASSFETVLEQFYNMLKRYHLESNGKVTYQFVDLDASPALAAAYEQYEVETGTVLFLCGERYQTLYLPDLMTGSMNTNTMDMMFNSQAERLFAAKMNLVSAPNAKKATILVGHDEDSSVISKLESLLIVNGCDVVQLDITASSQPDADTDVFIIAGAKTDYTVDEVSRLREWITNNEKREKDLLVFTNALVTLPNLYEMLQDEYGIEVLDQVICETDTDDQYGMDINNIYADVQSTDYTSALAGQRVLMPMANALNLHFTEDSDTNDNFSKPLVTSDESAMLLSLEDIRTMGTSVTQGQMEELMKESATYPVVSAAYSTLRLYDNTDQRYYTTDVMVFGSTQFMYEAVLNITSACNEDLFLNVFRGLTGLETTISISTRSMVADTLDFAGSSVPIILGYVFVGGLPLAMIIVAVVVFVRRRRL